MEITIFIASTLLTALLVMLLSSTSRGQPSPKSIPEVTNAEYEVLSAHIASVFAATVAMQGTAAEESDWHKVDAGAFSISAPSGWKFHQLPGVDSYVGEFIGGGVMLRFDFGDDSNPLKGKKEPAYGVVHKSIGGFRAKIVSPKIPGHGVTGVYFRNVGQSKRLCLWAKDLTSAEQELVLKIFETIRFGGAVPGYVIPPPAKNMQ
jgi:hypothetical protein